MFDESKIGGGELPEVPSRGDGVVPPELGLEQPPFEVVHGQGDETRTAAPEEAVPVVGGEEVKTSPEKAQTPEAEKPFDYEAESERIREKEDADNAEINEIYAEIMKKTGKIPEGLGSKIAKKKEMIAVRAAQERTALKEKRNKLWGEEIDAVGGGK